MDFLSTTDSWAFTWIFLPLLIMLARICDVSIGTLRLIFVSKGYKFYAPLLGFFEVIIWLLAIGQIMQHLDNFMCYIAYGLGFATGNYVGIYLEERMSLGTVVLRIIPRKDTTELIEHLRTSNFGVSAVEIEGMSGKLKMLFTIVKRKDLQEALEIISAHNPASFYTIEDIRTVSEGYFRLNRRRAGLFNNKMFRLHRLGK
jgi:uncharacterized protein YebE (UPF0316 family)